MRNFEDKIQMEHLKSFSKHLHLKMWKIDCVGAVIYEVLKPRVTYS